MYIREHELDVDFEEELEPYIDEFKRARVRGNKLQACSPFRDEEHPSFAVNLDNGTFIDSGGDSDYWGKGNFIKLLSFLQGVTYEETEDYLLTKYKQILAEVDDIKLNVRLDNSEAPKVFTAEEMAPFRYRHSYLAKRGISEQVQRAFHIGYDRKSQAVLFVWSDKEGQPINLKFRSVSSKIFWYAEGGQPIKNHVYGLNFIHRMNVKRAVVVEAETDCLYLWSLKIPAIALGTASMSSRQEELILNSPIETLVLGFDRDNAGNRAKRNVSKRLLGKMDVEEMHIPQPHKDVNDMPPELVRRTVENASTVIPVMETL